MSTQSGEAVLRKGETWLAALRVEEDRTRLLLDGETSISVFGGQLPFNIPRPKLEIDPISRKLDFAASFSSKPQAAVGSDAASDATTHLLRHLQPAMVRPLLQDYVNKGWLPVATQSDDAETTFGWIEFSARTPAVKEWQVRIAKDHHLASVESPQFSLRTLKYGPAGAFEVTPPAWPELPVVEHEKFEPSVMFRAMAALTKLWSDDEAPVTTTAQAVDAARN
ncbi:MAG: hypothetical protein H0T47_11030 [Planctomycetaceae bacterium]|nr:hypothetical protein [Planctomycetaceae bacterium]